MIEYIALPVLIKRKLKITMNTSTKHMASSANPNAQLVEINAYQQAVCVSWWLSNSSIKMSSALKARIVDSPSNDTVKCVNIGERPTNEINISLKNFNCSSEQLMFKERSALNNSLILSRRLRLLDVLR